MNYIIFDLEWNQCASEAEMVTQPLCLSGEIIEIGAVKLDDAFRKVDELRLFIRPQYYKKMHRAVASLTGIHDRDLEEKGLSFPDAFAKFQEWCGEEFSYMTWSTSDLPILIDNMLLHGIDVSSLPDTYDLQRIFCNEIMRFDRRLSLDDALKVLGERGDTAHDALNDSNNTVLVCNHLDLEEYADDYVARAFAEEPIMDVYPGIQEALCSPALAQYSCPWCGETVTAEPWLKAEHGEFITMGKCSEGDEILLNLELIRSGANRFHPRRVFYEMSNDLWDIYCTKKERAANP